jgi:heme-degrading monooxygenase HmoA
MLPPVSRRVVTIQQLQVAEEDTATFRAEFERLDVLALAAEAADDQEFRATLLQDGGRFVVVTTWSSEEAIDRWLASPARELVQAELSPYYTAPPVVNRYEIVSVH